MTNTENIENNASEIEQNKQAWVNSMRLQFCKRPNLPSTQNMIFDDGTLNQDYFRPSIKDLKRAKIDLEDQVKKFSEEDKEKLIKGIEQYGIGNFREISENLLSSWAPQELRVRTMRLIGRQNLQLYKDWKGDKEAIEKELEFNKELALKYNVWKNNTLVYDDEGNVLRELNIHHNIKD